MSVKSYHDLIVWQKSILNVNEVYKFTKPFPEDEKFGLVSQMRRSSVSIPSNIAEGWGRFYYKENIKFLLNSRGSVAEILDHSIEAKTWDYISDEVLQEIRTQTDSCTRLINGYIKYLRKQNDQEK